MIYWTAILLGLGGSLHCVGMCGPLMLSVPMDRRTRLAVLGSSLQYQLGRVAAYALIGSLFGLLGTGAVVAGVQRWLALAGGAVLIALAILQWRHGNSPIQLQMLERPLRWLRQKIGGLLRSDRWYATAGVGFLNGFIPCGLVYVAVLGAMTQAHWLEGALFMALFGLGTVPMLLGVMWLGGIAKPRFRHYFQFITPVLLLIGGALLLFRGLEITFPQELAFWEALNNPTMCHD